MVQVTYVALAPAALLVLGSLGTVLYLKFWKSTNLAIVNRTYPSLTNLYPEEENYVPSIDHTTFTVDKEIWLEQVDIPRIYPDGTGREDYSPIQIANVTIFEKPDIDSENNFTYCIRYLNTMVSSENETQLMVSPAVLLKPGKVYEIHVEMKSKDISFMYKGTHEIRRYKIKGSFFRTFTVKFYHTNREAKPTDNMKPTNETDASTQKSLSQGVIQRLYLKY